MRLVLIGIPDNADADAFVEAISHGAMYFARRTKLPAKTEEDIEDPAYEVSFIQPDDWKVEAVWAKPTKFCDCPDYNGTSTPTSNYRWMVHAKCAKPHPRAMQHPKDLTRVDWKPQEIPYYLGFRADGLGWVYRKEDR